MLWNDILKHFTLPKCVQPNFVKGWTLSRMTTQLKNFKKQVDRNYFKKRTPNLDEYLKLIDHWESFMEYKKSEEFTKASARGNKSVGKKGEYIHRLGRGGYTVAIPKWHKVDNDLLTKGIIPAVFDWPKRSKIWYYAHGGRLNPEVAINCHSCYVRRHLSYWKKLKMSK